jgi:hypothetical protein
MSQLVNRLVDFADRAVELLAVQELGEQCQLE